MEGAPDFVPYADGHDVYTGDQDQSSMGCFQQPNMSYGCGGETWFNDYNGQQQAFMNQQWNQSVFLASALCELRRLAISMGLDAAVSRCHQEGLFLAGVSVYCHPAVDQKQVRKIVETLGGHWIEKEPDKAMAEALQILEVYELEEWAGCSENDLAEYMVMQKGLTSANPFGAGFSADAAAPSLSDDSYLETSLRDADMDGYSAAGIQMFRRTEHGVELLCPTEKTWNSKSNEYDALSLNILGTKRIAAGWETDPHDTASRCMQEIIAGVPQSPRIAILWKMCHKSVAAWYPRGKYALFLHEVEESSVFCNLTYLERFAASKEERLSEKSSTKWPKQIDTLEWILASDILERRTKLPLTDLLDKFCAIEGMQQLLKSGADSLPPCAEVPDDSMAPKERSKDGKGKGKRNSDDGGGVGKGMAHKNKSPASGKGNDAKGKPPPGYQGVENTKGKDNAYWVGAYIGKGKDEVMGSDWNAGKGKHDFSKGIESKGAGPADWNQGFSKGSASNAKGSSIKGKGDSTKGKPSGKAEWLEDVANRQPAARQEARPRNERQMVGEQLYALLQRMVPTTTMAQKITGMLLELPMDELTLLVDQSSKQGREELKERCDEAMEILTEQGFK